MLTLTAVHIIASTILLYIEQTPSTGTLLRHRPDPLLRRPQRHCVWMHIVISIAGIPVMIGNTMVETRVEITLSAYYNRVGKGMMDLTGVAVR